MAYFMRIAGGLVIVGVALAAAPAIAGCNGASIGAQFSEAAKLCGAATSSAATSGPVAPAPMPAVVVANRDPVSVSMPGYRKRLAAAVGQVRRAGGAAAPDSLIVAVGQRYRIDPHLLASIVATESAGRPGAISNKGALGLMQVMPATARSLGVRNPQAMLTDRALALSTGAAYLKQLQGQFGNNVPLVVAAYNAGPGAVKKYKGIPRYRETQGYVGKVMGRYTTAREMAR